MDFTDYNVDNTSALFQNMSYGLEDKTNYNNNTFTGSSSYFPSSQHPRMNAESDVIEYGVPMWQQSDLHSYQFPTAAGPSTSIADCSVSRDLHYNALPNYMNQWSVDALGPQDTAAMGEFMYSDFRGPFEYNFDPLELGSPPSSRRSSASDISSCSSSSPYSQFVQLTPTAANSRAHSPANSDSSSGQTSRRRFPCLLPDCGRRFTSQYTLKVHMEAHKPKPRVSFPCTLGCSERFSRQHDRLRHEVAKHNKVCEFLCNECGRFFSTQKTLGNHKCPMAQGGTRWIHTN